MSAYSGMAETPFLERPRQPPLRVYKLIVPDHALAVVIARDEAHARSLAWAYGESIEAGAGRWIRGAEVAVVPIEIARGAPGVIAWAGL